MSTAGIFITLILVGLSIAFVVLPLVRSAGTKSRAALARKARDEVLTAYERVLATLRDLDEDFHTGKLAEHEYQEERSRRIQQGTLLLQHLETLDAANPPETIEVSAPAAVEDDAVEALIARYAQTEKSY